MVERIRAEYEYIKRYPNPYIGVGLVNNNIRHWKAHIIGAEDTPYKGGLFIIEVFFPYEYPEKPPIVKFETPIYHPNIKEDGTICISKLSTEWTPDLSMSAIFNYIIGLMGNPNASSPLRSDLAELMINNRVQFDINAEEFTKMHAF